MPERLTRPVRGAPEEARRQFGHSLLGALDRLGVAPGEQFFVTKTANEAHARRDDPATSKVAAQSVTALRESQKAVLRIFQVAGEPLTDEELVLRFRQDPMVAKQSESGIRTRRSELVAAGLLRDTGNTKRISTGGQATLWGLPVAQEPQVQVVGLEGVTTDDLNGPKRGDPYDPWETM